MTFEPIEGVMVIGVSGKARHGKDTAARAMIVAEPSLVTRYAFADGIKTLARVQLGMTRKDAPLLQRAGVEARERDIDVWLKNVYWRIDEERPAVAVITDVRFPNEARMVRAMGGLLLRVERKNLDGSPYVDISRDPKHVSETALDNWLVWDCTVSSSNHKDVELIARQVLRQALIRREKVAA